DVPVSGFTRWLVMSPVPRPVSGCTNWTRPTGAGTGGLGRMVTDGTTRSFRDSSDNGEDLRTMAKSLRAGLGSVGPERVGPLAGSARHGRVDRQQHSVT